MVRETVVLRLSRVRSEAGAELVEFALVLPIMLLVVAGIIDFGLLLQRQLVVTNAAREGARIAILPNYGAADVQARVTQFVREGLNDAALALMLGGSPETAARAVALYGAKPAMVAKPALDELGELWYRSFGYWSTDDLEAGLLFKYVENAEAISRVSAASAAFDVAYAAPANG